jgi:hypothetical protein
MANTPEGKVKDTIKKILGKHTPVWWFMPATGGYGKSGVPDFVVCVKGKFLAIEAKATAKSPITSLQKKAIVEIGDAEGYATVLYDENVERTLPIMLAHMGATLK